MPSRTTLHDAPPCGKSLKIAHGTVQTGTEPGRSSPSEHALEGALVEPFPSRLDGETPLVSLEPGRAMPGSESVRGVFRPSLVETIPAENLAGQREATCARGGDLLGGPNSGVLDSDFRAYARGNFCRDLYPGLPLDLPRPGPRSKHTPPRKAPSARWGRVGQGASR